MISFHTNHRLLAIVPVAVFFGLTLVIAVVPAIPLRPDGTREHTEDVRRGRELYNAEGCPTCHSQQVRMDTRLPLLPDGRGQVLAQDARYGPASAPEDYAFDDPPFLGSERTGPDLANIGERMPSFTWHLAHLYDPRMVVPSSVMPAYKWYFKDVGDPAAGERKVQLTEAMRRTLGPNAEVWATRDAVALVEYLISLRPAGRAKRP